MTKKSLNFHIIYKAANSMQKQDVEYIIEVKNLYISFGDKQVLNNINFKVEQGDTLGLVGESGSGKSLTSLACSL